jgi:hypothetical protein
MLPLLALTLAAAPMKLMMPVASSVGVGDEKVRFFTTQLAQRLRAQGLEVVTSDEIAVLLGIERQRQLLGCANSESCLAEVSNALGTAATVKMAIAKVDDVFQLSVTVLGNDTQVRAELSLRAASERALLDALDDAGVELARKLGVAPPVRLRPQAYVPGLLGVLAGAAGALCLWQSSVAFGLLNSQSFGVGEGELVASRGNTLQWAGLGLIGAGAALLVAGIVVFLVQEIF